MRALTATARATAWLVTAGSARMTTRAPVMVLAVSLGAIQMTRQPATLWLGSTVKCLTRA